MRDGLRVAPLTLELVLRVSATPESGAGHVMRMAALGDAWVVSGLGHATLWGEVTVPYARRRLDAIGLPVVGERLEPGASVLVCDTYDRGTRAAAAACSGCVLRVLVDDLAEVVEPGYDAVWNPNAYAEEAFYRGFGGAVLAGAEYVPLRRDLPRWAGRRDGPVVVMLGGSRLPPSLSEALARLAERAGFDLVGPVEVMKAAGWRPLAPENPWPAIAEARALIASSGTTIWEAAYVGVPVVPVRIAANQDLVYRWAIDAGAAGVDALALGFQSEAVARALAEAVPRARRLPRITNGASRVARRLNELARAAAGSR